MAFFRPIGLRLTIGISVPTLYLSSHILFPRRTAIFQCQTAPYLHDRIAEAAHSQVLSRRNLYNDENDDVPYDSLFNPMHFRQISTGSFGGVVAGYMVGKLSRMFAFVTLLVILVVQLIERQGLHIVPWQRIKNKAGEVQVKRIITENPAFRWSFAATFALSAWFAN
ncbi:hypothetical protein H072_8661 [Dactylellina haptotyla CBS 200.50]|uniref:FUN14 domain-containing protein n=1 Tax=Dactylellina haptotyla (strain CBS 200.50) TaxID=1284197 RepID=S8A3Q7_DACHA|nr:hypothetical protein H072_8661 [Dactylellina haptotyla CBS 200.50]